MQKKAIIRVNNINQGKNSRKLFDIAAFSGLNIQPAIRHYYNSQAVIENGKHTGMRSGRPLYGPAKE